MYSDHENELQEIRRGAELAQSLLDKRVTQLGLLAGAILQDPTLDASDVRASLDLLDEVHSVGKKIAKGARELVKGAELLDFATRSRFSRQLCGEARDGQLDLYAGGPLAEGVRRGAREAGLDPDRISTDRRHPMAMEDQDPDRPIPYTVNLDPEVLEERARDLARRHVEGKFLRTPSGAELIRELRLPADRITPEAADNLLAVYADTFASLQPKPPKARAKPRHLPKPDPDTKED